jgi:hypothetical protein
VGLASISSIYRGSEITLDAVREYALRSEDVAVGITATTPQLPAVMQIASAIRTVRPNLRLMLGGPHVTLSYSALKLERKKGIQGGRAQLGVAQLESMFDVLCTAMASLRYSRR